MAVDVRQADGTKQSESAHPLPAVSSAPWSNEPFARELRSKLCARPWTHQVTNAWTHVVGGLKDARTMEHGHRGSSEAAGRCSSGRGRRQGRWLYAQMAIATGGTLAGLSANR